MASTTGTSKACSEPVPRAWGFDNDLALAIDRRHPGVALDDTIAGCHPRRLVVGLDASDFLLGRARLKRFVVGFTVAFEHLLDLDFDLAGLALIEHPQIEFVIDQARKRVFKGAGKQLDGKIDGEQFHPGVDWWRGIKRPNHRIAQIQSEIESLPADRTLEKIVSNL